jgi:histone H3/H4
VKQCKHTVRRREKRPHMSDVCRKGWRLVLVCLSRAWECSNMRTGGGSQQRPRHRRRPRHPSRSLRRRNSLMDSGAHKLLESATQRTLHAHAFSRSSSQASAVLTDLLSRYLTLLSATCAKYAQHAGRTGLTVHDAISALDDLGVSLDELSEYCSTEGKELNRYALYSARRVEDLHEFKCMLVAVLLPLNLISSSPTRRGTPPGP